MATNENGIVGYYSGGVKAVERLGIALVTGGSRGIGQAIAGRLARDGFHVALTYHNRREAAEAAVADIVAQGGRATALRCDVGSLEAIASLFAEIDQLVGPLSVLVANAAVFESGAVQDFADDTFTKIMNLNVRSAAALARLASPRLMDNGRMIFLSSVAAYHASPTHILYAMSKAALEPLVRGLAVELGARGITANALMPGLTETDMADDLCAILSPNVREIVGEQTALGRLGRPDDIAAVASFLAGLDSGWVTGQTIDCTGGYRL